MSSWILWCRAWHITAENDGYLRPVQYFRFFISLFSFDVLRFFLLPSGHFSIFLDISRYAWLLLCPALGCRGHNLAFRKRDGNHCAMASFFGQHSLRMEKSVPGGNRGSCVAVRALTFRRNARSVLSFAAFIFHRWFGFLSPLVGLHRLIWFIPPYFGSIWRTCVFWLSEMRRTSPECATSTRKVHPDVRLHTTPALIFSCSAAPSAARISAVFTVSLRGLEWYGMFSLLFQSFESLSHV